MGRGQQADSSNVSAIRRSENGRSFSSADVPMMGIAYDDEGFRSIGPFATGAAEKERIDLARNALAFGDRALTFHGPRGSGKSALATQVAAILAHPYVKLEDRGGEPWETKRYWLAVDGEYYDAHLKAEQMEQLLFALENRAVIHLDNFGQLGLQKALGHALQLNEGKREIGVQELDDSGDCVAGLRKVPIHRNTVAIFEITEPPATEYPELNLEAVADTSPIYFDEPSDFAQRQMRESGSGYSPSFGGEMRSENGERQDLDPDHDMTYLWEAVDALNVPEANERVRPRDQLREELTTRLCGLNPAFSTPKGRRFIDKWLSQMEYQAYWGDHRAERTLMLGLQAFLPPAARQQGQTNPFFGDPVKGLREWSDKVHAAGKTAHASLAA